MLATRLRWRNCWLEKLTATLQSASPWSRQARSWRQAVASTHSPMVTISPECSATGMKSPGGTRPVAGSFQRTSASKPQMAPEARVIFGW